MPAASAKATLISGRSWSAMFNSPSGLSRPEAQKRAKATAKRPLAILDGSVNDGASRSAGPAKGKGKGAGKSANSDETFEGKPICYNWNRGVPCKAGEACTYAHVCLICKKADHPKIRHP